MSVVETPDEPVIRRTLSEPAARQLANATKTRAQWSGITPRWLVSFLPWSPVESGIYRLNRVREAVALSDADVECSPRRDTDADLPETFVDYEAAPREYSLNAITTVLDVQTRVSDLYSHPYDQIQEQLRLLIEKVKERQESELINNAEYGLLSNLDDRMRVRTRLGTPTPDDLDELIARFGMPAFAKIDVEGFEPFVLEGLTQAPAAISFEYLPGALVEVRRSVTRLGALGPYRFNWSQGETYQLFSDDWLTPEKRAMKRTRSLPSSSCATARAAMLSTTRPSLIALLGTITPGAAASTRM